jgi:hypothetical protein
MPATLLHRRCYGGASPAAIIHSACSPSPHPRRGYHISGHRSGTVTSELQWRDDKEKEAMKASLSFPILTHNQGDWALVIALLLEMLSIRQSVRNGHFQRLLLCEVLHTRWKAKLLGIFCGGEKRARSGEKAMMNVATALVESSVAETLLVIIVALFAVDGGWLAGKPGLHRASLEARRSRIVGKGLQSSGLRLPPKLPPNYPGLGGKTRIRSVTATRQLSPVCGLA